MFETSEPPPDENKIGFNSLATTQDVRNLRSSRPTSYRQSITNGKSPRGKPKASKSGVGGVVRSNYKRLAGALSFHRKVVHGFGFAKIINLLKM